MKAPSSDIRTLRLKRTVLSGQFLLANESRVMKHINQFDGLLIDCEGVEEADEPAIRELHHWQVSAVAAGKSFALFNVNEAFYEVIQSHRKKYLLKCFSATKGDEDIAEDNKQNEEAPATTRKLNLVNVGASSAVGFTLLVIGYWFVLNSQDVSFTKLAKMGFEADEEIRATPSFKKQIVFGAVNLDGRPIESPSASIRVVVTLRPVSQTAGAYRALDAKVLPDGTYTCEFDSIDVASTVEVIAHLAENSRPTLAATNQTIIDPTNEKTELNAGFRTIR